ncbi:hypothetical protein [Vibrio caribbeanicus]|uniref:Uncharacterized protein n=1 Tax=Vibrio caribbeanicus ATCC BAA-2122 TaxID=796620 RepID=E3BGI6_9VIBR|nr:hypothetical protein [Vibrio caribbeanicus]EFP97794.1 hypothetical protein VIBC2010_00824 [Vibrio caribbeanicus ATCC BAA-2122]
MGSTDLMTYLNYMQTWDEESDSNINQILDEHGLFVGLGDFASDKAVDEEFDSLVDLAKEVRDWTVAADSIEMAADAAAIASFWSFGIGMAAFVALQAEAAVDKAVASSKAKELNKKLENADTDISKKINSDVLHYIEKYKKNNNLIVSKAPAGLDTQACRSSLLQFIGEIEKKGEKATPDLFRQYASSARVVFKSDEINQVKDALDELNFSDKSKEDVTKFMKVLADLPVSTTFTRQVLTFTQGISLSIALRNLKMQQNTIQECAEAAGLPLEEVDSSALKMMDSSAKFALGISAILTVVNVVLDIINLIDVVKQCNKMVDELNGSMRENYKKFFNQIKDASKAYNEAISGADDNKLTPPNKASKDSLPA